MAKNIPIPLVEPDAKDGMLADVFDQIRTVRGEVTNLFRVIANEPTLLPPFFALSHRVRDESILSARLVQLAVLATAFAIRSDYEIAHHLIEAERAGITAEEIAGLSQNDPSGFAPEERCVIDYARQVTVARTVDAETLDDVLASLGPAGTVELAVLVGWYHLVAAVLEPLRVTIEPHMRGRGRRSTLASNPGIHEAHRMSSDG
jgi:4-carboxymuconolactone decarboxylase